MLSVFRRHAYSWTIRILLGLIVVVFAFWGIGTGFFSRVRPVATVDGQTILADELDQEATRIRRLIESRYGSAASEFLKTTNLRQEALDHIIENFLTQREARRLGIEISDADLKREIASQAAFQVDGQFDFRAYQEVLRENDLDPARYEESMRSEMVTRMLRQMVEQAVQVSDDEARREYDLRNENFSLSYIAVPYASLTSAIHPTAKEVQGFYDRERESFREPDRVRVVYIHYEPAILAAKLEPSAREIEDFYKANLASEFTHQEEISAHHMLIRVPEGASAAVKQAARAKAEDIIRQLKGGADFAKLAERYSEDPLTSGNGGELGFFHRGQLLKPFEEAAFKLKPGEIGLAETNLGYHVIRVDQVRPAHTDPLAQVRAQIIDEIKHKSGARLARQALNEDLSAALAGEDVKTIAEKRGLGAVETDFFSAAEPPPEVRGEREFIATAFRLEAGGASAVAGKKEAPYLVKLVGKKPSFIPPLKAISAKVTDAYVRTVAESEARGRAEKILGQIKSPKEFSRVAAQNKLEIRTTPEFSRADDLVPGIGSFPELGEAAAAVPTVPSIIGRVMQQDGNAYVFEVLSRQPPSDKQWEKDAAIYKGQILEARRAEAWKRFLDGLKSRAAITVDPSQLGTSAESSM